MTTYTPTDNWILPLVQALESIAGQITGVGRVYTYPPEGAVEDNSVLFPIKAWEILDDTNGKMKIQWEVEVHHVFQHQNIDDALTIAQTYVSPWLQVLTSWPNSSLNNNAIVVNVKNGKFLGLAPGGLPYISLMHSLSIITEYNIPLS